VVLLRHSLGNGQPEFLKGVLIRFLHAERSLNIHIALCIGGLPKSGDRVTLGDFLTLLAALLGACAKGENPKLGGL